MSHLKFSLLCSLNLPLTLPSLKKKKKNCIVFHCAWLYTRNWVTKVFFLMSGISSLKTMTLRTKEHLTTHLGLSACQVLRASQGVQERGVLGNSKFPEAGAGTILCSSEGDLWRKWDSGSFSNCSGEAWGLPEREHFKIWDLNQERFFFLIKVEAEPSNVLQIENTDSK